MTATARSSYNYIYVAGALFFVLYILFGIVQKVTWSGWLLMSFFILLSLAFQGSRLLKGFSFSLIIFAAVT